MLRSPFESAVLDGRTPLPKLSESNDFSQGGHQIGQGRRCSTLLHWVAHFKRHYLCIFLNPKGSVLLIRTNLRTRVATTIGFDQSAGLRSVTIDFTRFSPICIIAFQTALGGNSPAKCLADEGELSGPMSLPCVVRRSDSCLKHAQIGVVNDCFDRAVGPAIRADAAEHGNQRGECAPQEQRTHHSADRLGPVIKLQKDDGMISKDKIGNGQGL